ncbi:MAG: hypothetical protein JXQ75_00195, partial [Phycisphaerae bacterium]|nr:hypothetical protein [Phycisphaerae bacterium]
RHASDRTPYCPSCDYNLTGNVSGRCPECGELIPDEDLTRSRRGRLFRNPFEALQDAVTGRSRSTKSFVVYVVYALVMALFINWCLCVARSLPW